MSSVIYLFVCNNVSLKHILDILSAQLKTTVYLSHSILKALNPTSLTITTRDFLAILVTLTSLKCVFSVSSDVITKKRNRLTKDLV
jgi:hypothetical protein